MISATAGRELAVVGGITTLQNWIETYGGREKLAFTLGVTGRAVDGWTNRVNYPRVLTMLKLIELSKGALTLNAIVRSCAPIGAKLPRVVTRGE